MWRGGGGGMSPPKEVAFDVVISDHLNDEIVLSFELMYDRVTLHSGKWRGTTMGEGGGGCTRYPLAKTNIALMHSIKYIKGGMCTKLFSSATRQKLLVKIHLKCPSNMYMFLYHCQCFITKWFQTFTHKILVIFVFFFSLLWLCRCLMM